MIPKYLMQTVAVIPKRQTQSSAIMSTVLKYATSAIFRRLTEKVGSETTINRSTQSVIQYKLSDQYFQQLYEDLTDHNKHNHNCH